MRETGLERRRSRERLSPEQLQHRFYTETADSYDAEMVRDGDEHYIALEYISSLVNGFGYRSVLDVGTGTGRGVRHLLERHDGLEVHGVEPVRAMIDQAEREGGVPVGCIVEARGDELPFPAESFDAVCELGVLHHVADPDRVVAEMTRVARRAVFLSDENRFANGGLWRRAVKWSLYRLGLWQAAYRLANRGRRFHLSEGDGGVVYSYSVYDSLPALNAWADRVFLIPTTRTRSSWFHPLFTARTILICAVREG